MKILNLIGYKNLLLLIFVQLTFKYGFLEQQHGIDLALNNWQFILLVISSVLIAGAGFLINTIISTQRNFSLSEEKLFTLYAVMNILGVGIGFYLSNLIEKPSFILFFIIIATTLYFYANSFRQNLLIGNFLIALIAPLSIISIGIFDIYPMITTENRDVLSIFFQVLLDYAIFGFFITFMLQIVTDLKNTDTDYNSGKNTLPIVLGKERTNKVVFFITLIPAGLALYYGNTYIINLLWALIFGLLFILGPVIYFMIKIWNAKTEKQYAHLAAVLKWILFFTAISIAVITFNIQYNA